MPLTAIAINCTLKARAAASRSTDKMIGLIADGCARRAWIGETIRIADHDVMPGVSVRRGGGRRLAGIRARILAADILIFGTPIWMGQPSSVAKRVIERMDAFLSETDDQGRMPSFGKVALVAVVGNEDGAHYVSAQDLPGAERHGLDGPAGGTAYWVGEAMGNVDFQDLPKVPDKVTETVKMAGDATRRIWPACSRPTPIRACRAEPGQIQGAVSPA